LAGALQYKPASQPAIKKLMAKTWLIPGRVLAYLLTLLSRSGCLRTDTFGRLYSLLYPTIDLRGRYTCVAEQIKTLAMQPARVLDVGGADGIIRGFLDPGRYRLCILDINADALKTVDDTRLAVVAGDGCHLPFEHNAFDVVVSVDSLEHVPEDKKPDYCCELKRVAKRYVIIHCPADSSDGSFQGTVYDTKFLEWYRQRFKRDEPNTAEHLSSGLPKVEKLMKLFPGAIIAGRQNGEVWLRYMTRGRISSTGLFYKLFLERKDNLPPYHACLLVWKKG
jgi:ubiquinone/menaquinone biosynthesis C-methylase UbiE